MKGTLLRQPGWVREMASWLYRLTAFFSPMGRATGDVHLHQGGVLHQRRAPDSAPRDRLSGGAIRARAPSYRSHSSSTRTVGHAFRVRPTIEQRLPDPELGHYLASPASARTPNSNASYLY